MKIWRGPLVANSERCSYILKYLGSREEYDAMHLVRSFNALSTHAMHLVPKINWFPRLLLNSYLTTSKRNLK
jgi:hypothetical protein